MNSNDDNQLSASPEIIPQPWMQDDVTTASGDNTDAAPRISNIDTADTQPIVDPAISDHVVDDLDTYIAILLRDGLDQPIPGLPVKIEVAGEPPIEATTSEQGAVVVPKSDSEATLQVLDASARYHEVCKIDPTKCTTGTVIVRSPKVVEKVPLRPHHTRRPASSVQTQAPAPASCAPAPAPATPSSEDHGWFQTARNWLTKVMHPHDSLPSAPDAQRKMQAPAANKSGNPIAIITGPECPNQDNLCLGENNRYRQAIIDAGKRLGLCPQAICALIDCEAAMETEKILLIDKEGKPLRDKRGKPLVKEVRKHWKADSGNDETGAVGLTQFLPGTWLTHAMVRGFFLQEQSAAKGWVRNEITANGKRCWNFVLADGKTTATPWQHLSDANVRQCLAMRKNPTWSIQAAADYGSANLKLLSKAKFNLKGLNDMDKAKLMYLLHHEGETAGPLFIRNELANGKGGLQALRKKFEKQLGKDGTARAREFIERAGGDVEIAYRIWLADYVDKRFKDSVKYFCSLTKHAADLTELLKNIGGAEIKQL